MLGESWLGDGGDKFFSFPRTWADIFRLNLQRLKLWPGFLVCSEVIDEVAVFVCPPARLITVDQPSFAVHLNQDFVFGLALVGGQGSSLIGLLQVLID